MSAKTRLFLESMIGYLECGVVPHITAGLSQQMERTHRRSGAKEQVRLSRTIMIGYMHETRESTTCTHRP